MIKRSNLRVILLIALVALAGGPGGRGVQAKTPEGLPVGGVTVREGDPLPASFQESPNWKWFIVAGDVFQPASNTITWQNRAGGCLEPNSAGYWRASLNLPDGSVLKRFDFGYWNEATSGTSLAYIYHFPGSDLVTSVVTADSVGGNLMTGYMFRMVDIANVVVNNREGAYDFVWSGSVTQHLCFLRVAYVPPGIFGQALPLVKKGP